MSEIAATDHDAHQRIRLLLPWFVNRSLAREEHEQVESHVRLCLSCRRELVGLGRLAAATAVSTDSDVAAAASFSALAARLPQRGNVVPLPQAAPAARPARAGFARYLPYALAASITLALVPFVLRMAPEQQADAAFRTLSATVTAPRPHADLRVVFAPALSDAEVAGVLAGIGGTRVGTANSAGAIDVVLGAGADGAAVQRALVTLRARGDVILAEPALQP